MNNVKPSRSSPRLALTGIGLVSLVVLTGCSGGAAAAGAAAGAALPGEALYGACISCHGKAGEGNLTIGAPRIAGLPAWYVTGQLQRFQTGLRGEHPDDSEGLRMRAMAKQMMSEAEITAVSTHVSSLPAVINPATRTDANAAAGQATFAICATCHGMQGEGNQAVNAPPIAGLDDWYIERQLQKFRDGVRGTTPGDTIGPIMRGMALTVPPDAIKDLAAYVHALPRQP